MSALGRPENWPALALARSVIIIIVIMPLLCGGCLVQPGLVLVLALVLVRQAGTAVAKRGSLAQ